jgi:PAS domain-containing protein
VSRYAFSATIDDIAERKQAELALAGGNLQLALAGKAGLIGRYAYDVDTEMMQVSEGYAALHGFPEGTSAIRAQQMAGWHPPRGRGANTGAPERTFPRAQARV